METMERVESSTEATRRPSRIARLRNRVSAVLVTMAVLVGVPTAAFAQTTPPTLPDATTTANNLVNQGGTSLVNVAVGVIPTVISVLVIFWAIRFALSKLGLRGHAHV